jgi:hypothetical protein
MRFACVDGPEFDGIWRASPRAACNGGVREAEMPISSTVAALLTGDVSAADVVPLLMPRRARSTSTGSRSDPSATGQHSERT